MALGRLFRRRCGAGAVATLKRHLAGDDRRPRGGSAPSGPHQAAHESLEQFWRQQRYALILSDTGRRGQTHDGEAIVRAARERLDTEMALVPEGIVSLPTSLDTSVGADEVDVHVRPLLLDVCAATNAQFQDFVDAGGYARQDLWPEAVRPHLIEMRDQTGQTGPRFWRHGRHDKRLADHPAVGITVYEAEAFARWIGKRLPTEAEWQMAASWHLKTEANILRRFPWGDAMDVGRCNVWASRRGGTVPVGAYPEGAAPNGVLQLIGNVWEWTASPFEITDTHGRPILGEMPMRSVRGGAFDTYFETQATSLFRTGHVEMGRVPNLGFRCALDVP